MAKQLSLEQIINCGVNQTIAAAMLPQINYALASLPAIECWQYFSREILKPNHPFPLHELLYQTVFADWDFSQDFPPVWIPSQEQIQATNITALRKYLNLASYSELHSWTVENRAESWEMMIQRLNIRFQAQYTQIVEISQGIESPH